MVNNLLVRFYFSNFCVFHSAIVNIPPPSNWPKLERETLKLKTMWSNHILKIYHFWWFPLKRVNQLMSNSHYSILIPFLGKAIGSYFPCWPLWRGLKRLKALSLRVTQFSNLFVFFLKERESFFSLKTDLEVLFPNMPPHCHQTMR